jgi:uncharacterized protein with NAD-binding domain and iron-sulfur cluster
VVILGGGAAGLTTAMELSRPGWQQRFESITVYQQGWRLGGKGASGRGDHDRIEEHGLHIWLGFYRNAFRMMHDCYDELARGPESPIRSVEDAFERASLFIVQEPRGDGWVPWFASFPETDDIPGQEPASELPSLWEVLLRGLRLAWAYDQDAKATAASDDEEHEVSLTPVGDADAPTPGGGHGWVSLRPTTAGGASGVSFEPAEEPLGERLVSSFDRVYEKVRGWASDLRAFELAAALELAEGLSSDPAKHHSDDHDEIVGWIDAAVDRRHDNRLRPDDESDYERRLWYITDIMLAVVRGVLADGVLTDPRGLDAIDRHDLVNWLIRHGASPESAKCGLITTLMYDLPFAYKDGDPSLPSNSAGAALRGAIQTLFTYTGAIAWKMRAGMGDIVFAPIFEVLHRRGVTFEFFHRVEELVPSADGTRVESIRFTKQTKLKNEKKGYWPLTKPVQGIPCWPSAPLQEQLAAPITAEQAESFWAEKTPEASEVTLRAGDDFDTVVLGISVGAHPYICEQLLDLNPDWQQMADRIGTIYTQAFQLWSKAHLPQLVGNRPPATTGGYLEPFDTYADMQQLIERESWGAGKVNSIAYFCNVMPTPRERPSRDDRSLPRDKEREAKENALAFLEEAMAPLWPGGVYRYPTAFRWDLLVDDLGRSGHERFDSQYWRANTNPSDRYVQSLPGTARYRLGADESGFQNLVFAGDWTQCGLNSGCVEAAVMSGLLAAAAVEERSPRRQIIGLRKEGVQHVF